jgi:hypothetical protein
MTLADFIANGNEWPDDPASVCQASFPNNLAPIQTIEMVIGDDRVFDSLGVRSGCAGDPLLCDTAYVFRCRVNETQSCDASQRSDTITCRDIAVQSGSKLHVYARLLEEPFRRLAVAKPDAWGGQLQ